MERLKADATDNTSLAEHLSETNFYLGKYYLSLGGFGQRHGTVQTGGCQQRS
ncbi:hypothetical protein P4909_00700 [Escherichia coli]